jgi:hypothetical protein
VWPFPWLQVIQQAKVHGVMVAPQFSATLATSVGLVIDGTEQVLHEWATPLPQWAAAIEFFAVSKAWNPVQILTLPVLVGVWPSLSCCW